MPINKPGNYLICYDIADPRRLQRVHKFITGFAVPVQYSVFLARMTPAALTEILDGLCNIIEPAWDDVRAYRLPDRPRAVTMGRAILPPSVQLVEPEGQWTTAFEALDDSDLAA